MADDIKNRPNRASFPEDSGFEAIKNIGRKYSSKGPLDAQERQRLNQASESVNGLESLIEARPELETSAPLQRGIKEGRETINGLSARVSLRRETHRDRAIRDTSASVEREFNTKTINGEVRRASQGAGAQDRGMGMSSRSQRELEQERSGLMGQIGKLEERTLNSVQNDLYDVEGKQDPNVMQSIRANYRQKRAFTNKAATIDAALQKQRDMGTDEKSQYRSLFQAGKQANKTIFSQDVESELKSGQGLGALDNKQLREKEINESKGLAEALEKLKNSAGESAETIDKFKEQAHDAAEGLKRTKEAISQRGEDGGGGNFRRYAAMAPGLLNTAAAGVQEALINQPMQTMSNRLGFASLSNAQYGQRNAAINGDMTALLNSTSAVGGKMSEVGKNFSENAEIVRGLNAGAGAVSAGLGVAQIASAAKNNLNPVSQVAGSARAEELTAGINQTVGGLAQAGTAATDLINQSSSSSANLGGQQSIYALNNEVNKVRGDFRQSFYDYSQGSRSAALAAGGRGGRSIMSNFASDKGDEGGMLGQIQKARIAPNEFGALSAQAGLDQGSVFNQQSIFQARNLERSGVGTKEMNMERMGQLAGAGANNPQSALTSVLEAAFSKGLDSSKALNMMVQNTSEMARSSLGTSQLGMDTTAAASAKISSLVNGDNPNKESAISRAATAQQILQDQTTGIGSNFSDQLGITRIARAANVSSVGAMALKKLDDPTADALKKRIEDYNKATPNEQAKLSRDLQSVGLGEFTGDDGKLRTGDALKGLQGRKQALLGNGNFLNLVNPNTAGYDELASGKLTNAQIDADPKKYKALADQIGRASTFSGVNGREAVSYLSGESGITEAGKAEAKKMNSGMGGSQSLRDADDAATAGGADMANKARLAAKELGGAAEALGKINKQIQSLVGGLNDKTSGNFQDAASQAAKDFSNSAKDFGRAVDKFDQSVGFLNSIPTNTSQAVKSAVQPLIDKVGSMGGGSGDKLNKNGPRG